MKNSPIDSVVCLNEQLGTDGVKQIKPPSFLVDAGKGVLEKPTSEV